MFDSINTGICILDNTGTFIYVNNAHVKMTGTSKNEFYKLNVYDLKHSGVIISSIFEKVLNEKRKATMIQNVYTSLGKEKLRQLVTATPIFDGDGNVKYLIAEIYDALEIQRKYQTALVNDIPSKIFIEDTLLNFGNNLSLVGESIQMKELLRLSNKVAKVDSAVLVQGETGTGKEIIARYIHKCSKRSEGPFIAVNCAAIPDSLLEAELFGYEKGSFTGALTEGKKGLIESADKGILFLDEINSIPLSIQTKVLRTLESKSIKRIGSSMEKYVDFKLISATNQNLKQLIEEGKFRADLYYRINVIPLNVPPLRERKEDIIPLCSYYLKYFANKYNIERILSEQALNRLVQYEWPGNIRELKNLIERLVITSSDDVLVINEIPMSFFDSEATTINAASNNKSNFFDMPANSLYKYNYDDQDFSHKKYMDLCEKELLRDVLQKYGSTRKAAKVLKLNQSNVVRKKHRYNIM